MKKRTHFLAFWGFVFVVMMVVVAISPLTSAAEEKCRIIAINRADDFNPGTVTAKTGDCVVWLNWSVNRARIIFADKGKCTNMSSASGFTVYSDGCYVMDKLETGMTSSLTFNQPGTYDYAIEFYPNPLVGATSQITKRGQIQVE